MECKRATKSKKKASGSKSNLRKEIRMAYEEIENTNEYMETHYYKSQTFTSSPSVGYNHFWLDYAEYLLNRKENS